MAIAARHDLNFDALGTSTLDRLAAGSGTHLACVDCRAEGREQPAAASCRFCTIRLCSEHLTAALQRLRVEIGRECRHLFVASGWLAEAVYGRSA